MSFIILLVGRHFSLNSRQLCTTRHELDKRQNHQVEKVLMIHNKGSFPFATIFCQMYRGNKKVAQFSARQSLLMCYNYCNWCRKRMPGSVPCYTHEQLRSMLLWVQRCRPTTDKQACVSHYIPTHGRPRMHHKLSLQQTLLFLEVFSYLLLCRHAL